ncbi:MAG: hypothetical protein PGN16_04065 [Sphingomonas phyllosphaerae]|uniref:hypothetical protein n=1 Tax=Sphingomonas phyllosphaerae TaxID=257003 RepID=UPI002FFCEC49
MSYASEQGVLNGQWNAAEMAFQAECERARPFMLLKPRMFPDGGQWCALYGDNLQEGVAGFGNTPDAASRAFDVEWTTRTLTPHQHGAGNGEKR